MIRVLVVEDSATSRELLVDVLRSDPEIEVVGTAVNGQEGVALTQKLRPDVVTMDVNMPVLDGYAATKEIMITAPTPIIIVTASTTASDVNSAMNALRTGAVAIMPKPHHHTAAGFDEASRKLVSTIKAMASVKVVRHHRQLPPAMPRRPLGGAARLAAPTATTKVVAIATSTGGPAALQCLLGSLPGDFAVPILVVQHIARGFTRGLADWLNTVCDLRVKLADAGEPLAPHTVYVAPDDRHLGVAAPGVVSLSGSPPVGGFRPAGTYLFESVARVYGAGVTAIIMTGMGEDGLVGLRAVRKAGGRIFSQDEKSCVVFGMPGVAVAEGLPDLILPPEEMATHLINSL